ncbi:hypothetical protein KCU73_g16380, partial [Aureobasidium melanogenum]
MTLAMVSKPKANRITPPGAFGSTSMSPEPEFEAIDRMADFVKGLFGGANPSPASAVPSADS